MDIFEQIVSFLLDYDDLRKIILLGDILELPSVDTGNFLVDIYTYKSYTHSSLDAPILQTTQESFISQKNTQQTLNVNLE